MYSVLLFIWAVYFVIVACVIFYFFIWPRFVNFILDNRPISLTFPTTNVGEILKKYAEGMIIDERDEVILERLASGGLVNFGTYIKDLPNDRIEMMATARTTDVGLHLLRHGCY